MAAHARIDTDYLTSARAAASSTPFYPRGTVRCEGLPLFRQVLARDLGCLLDLDPNVVSWSCLPLVLSNGDAQHIPDFIVERQDSTVLMDAARETHPTGHPDWIKPTAEQAGYRHETLTASQIHSGFRLVNARDLLRYARWRTPLGDRVRLLAALEEHGSMTLAECLPAFRETTPIAGLASLILQRFVEIELDDARIGPETAVRRHRG